MSNELRTGYWEVGLGEYHADRQCVSSTSLELFRESRQEYHAVFVAGSRSPRVPSWEMRLGSALHALVLQPDEFDSLVAVEPKWGRKKDEQEAKAEWREANSGKITIDNDDLWRLRSMQRSLSGCKPAAALLEAKGTNEQAFRWEESGVWCKCCYDRLLECGIDVNLKTAARPEPEAWGRHAGDFGYHRQAALYRLAKERYISDEPTYHVVVGSDWPHAVGVYRLDAKALADGYEEVWETLEALKQCRQENCWLERWQTEVTEISLPRFRRKWK